MAEGVLFDLAASLIEMLGSAAFEEARLLCGVKDEFQKLVGTIEVIKGVLLDAEEKMAVDNQVKAWLKQLGDVFIFADDLVDKFHTEPLQRRLMSGNKFTRQVRLFFSSSNQLVFRFKVGHKIKDIREKLYDIRAISNNFQLTIRPIETIVVRGSSMRETYSYVREEEVIGREDEKREIIQKLVEMDFGEDVSFIPIVGIGGLGKTTLAQYVFNDERVQKHFESKMWVCVSDVFDVKLLVGKIVNSNASNSLENLQNELRSKLSGKKYLLVLDDVWNENGEEWHKLEMLLKCGGKGSRVLVTTRSEMVARITQSTVGPIKVKGLSEDMSWSLFKRMTFKKGQEPVEGSKEMELGMEVVKKCKGVPLAIRTIGRLLQQRLWQSGDSQKELSKFLNSEFAKIDQNENDILPTLKLSYNHLPSHLKHCFAYCRLFPKDHIIDVRELIQLWMAQGFIKHSDDKSQCLEEIGYEYFINLLWRSFFQEPKTDEFGDIRTCKIHDLMHDLAIKVAGSNSVIIDRNSDIFDEKCLHVSLVYFDLETNYSLEIFEFFSQQKRLRTLLLHSCKGLSFSKLEDFLSNFKCLRALSVPSMKIEVLPRNLCELEHLRYLNLSGNSELKVLPSSFIRLQNLQTLNLKNCNRLVRLPHNMNKLVNLRHLMIGGCNILREMPPEFGYMSSLHTLDRFVASESSGVHELSNLINNLNGSLTIEGLWRTTNYSASKTTSKRVICEGKHNLHSLTLQCNILEDNEMAIERLQPPSNLKVLHMSHFDGVRLGGWDSSLNNLVKLELNLCGQCQYLPKLDQLRYLEELKIKWVKAEYMCSSGEDDDFDANLFFPSLVTLQIEYCFNLKWWWWKKEVDGNKIRSFPRLSNLSIYHCSHLTSMPLFPTIEKVELHTSSSMALEDTFKMMRGRKAHNTHPNMSLLRSIVIEYCPDLTSLLVEGIDNLPSLRSVSIRHCRNLTSVLEGIDNLPSLESIRIYITAPI
ncbi:putative disease resistance protein RGA3 [Cannabis sativa]|uniref:putative disease resistance protein RGA3 n=1 Tax=Cannabis sativa TaxID=3483 RepID=UPI0029CA130A|nr:putative disease resistance protein RGA3 [Cannabis sativa]XP_060975068.1 putative disease resistance protein RGA3 [Cannabis sativa]XP_060975069.1 putative disease resistance protein RGA3 [Cannabis sativa]